MGSGRGMSEGGSDAERELGLLLENAFGGAGEKIGRDLRKVADAQTLIDFLRDVRLPTGKEIRSAYAAAMARPLGMTNETVKSSAEMMGAYRSNRALQISLDAQIGGISRELRACLLDGKACMEGVVKQGRRIVIRNQVPVEEEWNGDLFCDFCSVKFAVESPIWYCGIVVSWVTAGGPVDETGGYGICANCRKILLEHESLTYADMVLLQCRGAMNREEKQDEPQAR